VDGVNVPRIAVTTVVHDALVEPTAHARGPNLGRIADAVEHAARSGHSVAASAARREDLPISPDVSARRFYSFSSLSGALVQETARIADDEGMASAAARKLVEMTPAEDEAAADDVESSAARAVALDLGTLMHAIVADFRWDGMDDAAALARRHMARQLREDEALERQAVELVERLLSTLAAKEIAAARRRLAEVEFLLAWPPDSVADDDTSPILHGFIDMLYQDRSGQWHVVDYKTNHVAADGVAATAAGYEMQLKLYALAAEKTLGASPKSLRLCFLVPGVEHFYEWTPRDRQRTIALVSAAVGAS
jgi:ATP-dependent exoDNAse (exonuclease V) beta subunit